MCILQVLKTKSTVRAERGGGHTVDQLYFPKLKNLTQAQRHLRKSSQSKICDKNATVYPIVLGLLEAKIILRL